MSLFNQIGQSSQQSQLQQLKNNPKAMAQQRGWNIPESMYGNPQAMVQHLISTGQVGGPALQRVLPMIRQMTGR